MTCDSRISCEASFFAKAGLYTAPRLDTGGTPVKAQARALRNARAQAALQQRSEGASMAAHDHLLHDAITILQQQYVGA